MIDFVCVTYDLETGQELDHYEWSPSEDEARALFSKKEQATLARGEFVEIDDERVGLTTRYAIKEERKSND